MLTWKDYARMPEAELARCDIALVNLACAQGLPDAGNIDVALCLGRLDWWAREVKRETERVWPCFRRHRYEFRNSEGYFRILVMITELQRRLGLRYNPFKIDESVPLDTADVFIHGALIGNGGTCASLAVVYVAVGRRLGYPLKLVATDTEKWGHLFARWDEPKGERFNIEATCAGFNSDPDDYYRSGICKLTPAKEAAGCYLKSMSPCEELAGFLAERSWRWRDYGRHRRAAEAMAWACSLAPTNKLYFGTLHATLKSWDEELRPPDFPELLISAPQRRFPDHFPLAAERDILGLEATENLLHTKEAEEQWWGPMREGKLLTRVPARALVDFHPGGCNIQLQLEDRVNYTMEGKQEA